MQRYSALGRFCLAVSLLTMVAITGLMLAGQNAAPSPAGGFAGRLVSASGALVVGGEAANPGHPVPGATIHLVPVTAMDTTTEMRASDIYAPPYPAEAYDEPLEDAIRLRGTTSRNPRRTPRATSSSRMYLMAGSSSMSRRPTGHRTPTRWGPEQRELFSRAVARSVDDDPGFEQSLAGCPGPRQFDLSVMPPGPGTLATNRAQARMDRTGRSRADAGLFETPAVLRRAGVVSRSRGLRERHPTSSSGTTIQAGVTTSSS